MSIIEKIKIPAKILDALKDVVETVISRQIEKLKDKDGKQNEKQSVASEKEKKEAERELRNRIENLELAHVNTEALVSQGFRLMQSVVDHLSNSYSSPTVNIDGSNNVHVTINYYTMSNTQSIFAKIPTPYQIRDVVNECAEEMFECIPDNVHILPLAQDSKRTRLLDEYFRRTKELRE